MSSRPAQRRAPPPAAPSPHPPPLLSIEEWEANSSLDDAERRSVSTLKTAVERIPLPFKFTQKEEGSSRPSTPVLAQRNRLVPGSRPSTPPVLGATHIASSSYAPLHPKQPIQTPEQLYEWFSLVDRSVAHSQEAHIRAHIANISEHLQTCDTLLDNIDTVEKEVDGMLEHWRAVEEGGRSLKDSCTRLLQERDKLLEAKEEIDTRLDYFQELEHATRMLNHPGESLVLQTDFLYMVERVDICIEFLRNHEAEVYLLRFQQCMTRAMTLVKMFFVGSLRALTADITKRMSEKDVSSTAQMHFLYTRFKSVAAQLAPLLGELERRTATHPDELTSLLSECHVAYFSTRKTLLVNRLTEDIRGLDPSRTELVELTRAGCTYLKQLCTDEFNLYQEFFSSGEEALYRYLENLCDYLYDDLRPRILHEPRITALCEVCTVLQALMVLDVNVAPDILTSESHEVDELQIDFDSASPEKGLTRLHISQLLQMVLQDAQTRLFFKAQSMIQSDIHHFAPKPEDLNYPGILQDARKLVPSSALQEKESVSQMFQPPSFDKQDTWYPTLRKTVWILSQLHDFVKPVIFQDIAQEAIGLCRQSLVAASDTMILKTTPLDAHLFLVRHLLILKELVHKLDLEHRETERIVGVTDTLATMLNKTTLLFPNALFSTLGIPRAEETIQGAKSVVDHELRRACESVISHCVIYVCRLITSWRERVRDHGTISKLSAESWANQGSIEELDRNFRQACERDLRSSIKQIQLYLEDERTVNVLVTHVLEGITEEYTEFREVALRMHPTMSRQSLMTTAELGQCLQDACGLSGTSS